MRSQAQNLEGKKKHFFLPVHEPTTQNNIFCYYVDNLSLAYRRYYSRKKKSKEVIKHPSARQCYYCDNFFIKKKSFEKHVKTCNSITGIAYKRNN